MIISISHGAPTPHELQGWPTTVLTASTLGFLFGGFIGARWAGDKYIAMNHNTKYPHAMQAQVMHLVCLQNLLCFIIIERVAWCLNAWLFKARLQMGGKDGSIHWYI